MPPKEPPAAAPLPRVRPYTLSILVMPNQANHLGVMHGGHMLSFMDMAAWVLAARAVEPDQTVFFKAVTDCVWSSPIRAGEVCNVTATLAGVGRTSLRVALEARAEDPAAKVERDVCRAVFTMVTAGDDGLPEPVRLAGRTRRRPASRRAGRS
ncbi:MAG TPA: hotdog domain-containing protein [Miltoncostaeaceae bacterium]|nr:hotdog domain-containing protein [Miltoncostaeaceae bacterium]